MWLFFGFFLDFGRYFVLFTIILLKTLNLKDILIDNLWIIKRFHIFKAFQIKYLFVSCFYLKAQAHIFI